MEPCGHQSCNVGHVHHQVRAAFVRHLTEPFKVDGAAVGAGACDDELRLRLHGLFLQLVIVDVALVVDAVGNNVEIEAGKVHRASVGQVPAVIQVHAHDRVAWL